MRPLVDMDTIQIEITNHCQHRCSNCTRLVGHHRAPYFMEMDQFKTAVDSMVGYPKMTGMMGGEPLLHPKFREMCEYLGSKIPPDKAGLWTCFPKGYEHYRDVIVATFGNIFLNDQSKEDILHCPIMVTPGELDLPEWSRWYLINGCWVQNAWSASINPHGAWFCEIAGALSMLLGKDFPKLKNGWTVKPEWWTRTPKDFIHQMENFCSKCGAAMPLRRRASTEEVDDVSPQWEKWLRLVKSPKHAKGGTVLADLQMMMDDRPMATYKDPAYRAEIANRYGMFLVVNERQFLTPHLRRKWAGPGN